MKTLSQKKEKSRQNGQFENLSKSRTLGLIHLQCKLNKAKQNKKNLM